MLTVDFLKYNCTLFQGNKTAPVVCCFKTIAKSGDIRHQNNKHKKIKTDKFRFDLTCIQILLC